MVLIKLIKCVDFKALRYLYWNVSFFSSWRLPNKRDARLAMQGAGQLEQCYKLGRFSLFSYLGYLLHINSKITAVYAMCTCSAGIKQRNRILSPCSRCSSASPAVTVVDYKPRCGRARSGFWVSCCCPGGWHAVPALRAGAVAPGQGWVRALVTAKGCACSHFFLKWLNWCQHPRDKGLQHWNPHDSPCLCSV